MGRAQVWDGSTWVELTGAYDGSGGSSGDHALLSNVTSAQHHTKYTDAEAIAAVGDPGAGVYLPLTGGVLSGDLRVEGTVMASGGSNGDGRIKLEISGVPANSTMMRLRTDGPIGSTTSRYYDFRHDTFGSLQLVAVENNGVERNAIHVSSAGDVQIGQSIGVGVGIGDVTIRETGVPSLGWRETSGVDSGFSRFGENQVGFYTDNVMRTTLDNLGIVSPAVQASVAGNAPNLVIVSGTNRISRSTAIVITQEILDPLLAAIESRIATLESL